MQVSEKMIFQRFNPYSAGIDFSHHVCRRQILKSIPAL